MFILSGLVAGLRPLAQLKCGNAMLGGKRLPRDLLPLAGELEESDFGRGADAPSSWLSNALDQNIL
jgi:hypothetical protein